MKKPVYVHSANLAKHRVRPHEVEECFREGIVRYLRKAKKGVYWVVPQTLAGRYLEILFEERPHEILVFHAMDARPRHLKLLRRRGR